MCFSTSSLILVRNNRSLVPSHLLPWNPPQVLGWIQGGVGGSSQKELVKQLIPHLLQAAQNSSLKICRQIEGATG